jgi:NADH-quinone oxidoreductase subunit E
VRDFYYRFGVFMVSETTTAQNNLKDPMKNAETKALIDGIIAENKEKQGATMVVLNELQASVGFVTESMQQYVAEQLQVPISRVHGVVSFYSFFTTTPRGKHTIKFCMGTACYVGGTPMLIEKAKQILGIEPGSTTPDGNVTMEICRCVGACSQAPVIVVDENVMGRVQPNKLPMIVKPIQDDAG